MNTEPIIKLYSDKFGHSPESTELLPQSGSDRKYIRLHHNKLKVLGVYNPNVTENKAYFSFTISFQENGIKVPEILSISNDQQYYLVEDLGDNILFNYVKDSKGEINRETINYFKQALNGLIEMQVTGAKSIDFSKSFPVDSFNEDAIQWDLNYFKYNYLKLAGIEFDEFILEQEFKSLKQYLLQFPRDYFMFRDFQSRNIIIKDDSPYFIDFQGGRKGPLTYDVASLLYQAKAQLPENIRLELFNYYADELAQKIDFKTDDLYNSFLSFSLLRTLQVLGAYGFRGYFEKKPHFLESIPYAIENLKVLLSKTDFPLELPHLTSISEQLIAPKLGNFSHKNKLTVSITSFSYRKGIPSDPSQNGGGFVFDCRSIHNPGRYKEYQHLTGRDTEVIDFFEKEDEMENFLSKAFALVDRSVDVYNSRSFKHLMVNFGCTGGQHRSVYSAERLAKHLKSKYDIYVSLWHREQGIGGL